jgi:hypothetical protein
VSVKLLAGTTSGALAAALLSPTELVKVRGCWLLHQGQQCMRRLDAFWRLLPAVAAAAAAAPACPRHAQVPLRCRPACRCGCSRRPAPTGVQQLWCLRWSRQMVSQACGGGPHREW